MATRTLDGQAVPREDGMDRPRYVREHLGAVVDHVEAFSRGGAHDESNFVTSCNKCNARKNNVVVEEFQRAVAARTVKGRYGEPEHWDGLSTLFVLLARSGNVILSAAERGWLAALNSASMLP